MMLVPAPADLDAELKRQHLRVALVGDRLGKQVEKLYKNYIKTVKAELLDIKGKRELTDSQRTRLRDLATQTKVIGSVPQLLLDAGFDDFLEEYRDGFGKASRSALQYFELFGVDADLAGVDTDVLDAYINYSERLLYDQVDRRLVTPLSDAIFQSQFGSRPFTEIYSEFQTAAEGLSPLQSQALVDDSIQRFYRAVTVEKGEALEMEVVQYLGPDDAKTSPQCQALLEGGEHGVGGMYYVNEVTTDLHEDLEENPLIAGGHPGCRHQFVYLTLDYAKEQGFEP